jgi:hypothetical protein
VTAAPNPQPSVSGPYAAVDPRPGEWTAHPPGRLGRRLIAEVERYLEFFAIVGEPATA